MLHYRTSQIKAALELKVPWTPKLTYTFYPFSWKCKIFW